MDTLGLYLHVPFCRGKCPYCDFYSLPATDDAMDAYTDALLLQLAGAPGQYVDTVYFGGGTPTLLGERRLARILAGVAKRFTLNGDCEITTEANPTTSARNTLNSLASLGFTRVSLGLQSAVPEELKLLGRNHGAKDAAEAVTCLRQSGMENISLDLMLGTIGQTPESLRESLRFVASLSPAHVSAYLLKPEESTPYAAPRFREKLPDEDTQADLYLLAVEELDRMGLSQYEISNFSLPGRESRHNLKYWRCEEYLGLGPSAHSFVDGRRFCLPRNLEDILAASSYDALPFEEMGEGGSFFERFFLGLRLGEGVDLSTLEARFGIDCTSILTQAKLLARQGLALVNGRRITLTPKGFLLSNSVTVFLTKNLPPSLQL